MTWPFVVLSLVHIFVFVTCTRWVISGVDQQRRLIRELFAHSLRVSRLFFYASDVAN